MKLKTALCCIEKATHHVIVTCAEPYVLSHSVVSNSLQPHGLCSLPDSSVHGFSRPRILEWVAMPSSRGSSQPTDWTQVSLIAGRFFIVWAIREAQSIHVAWWKSPTTESKSWKHRHCRSSGQFPDKRTLIRLTVVGAGIWRTWVSTLVAYFWTWIFWATAAPHNFTPYFLPLDPEAL